MGQEKTPNAAMAALLERYREMVENPDQEALEREIYVEAWQGNWQEALRLLRLLPGPVTRETAGEYLFQALCSAPPQVFAELLDYLPHGEYTGRATVPAPWMPGNGRRRHHRWEVRMEGTLTLLAAAKNRPAHLAVLLEHGYDVNSASLPATAARRIRPDSCSASWTRARQKSIVITPAVLTAPIARSGVPSPHGCGKTDV